MTGLLFVSTFLLLSYFTVLKPYAAARKARIRSKFDEDVMLFKLLTVRSHYDSLQEYSYREILDKYDIEDAYNKIR